MIRAVDYAPPQAPDFTVPSRAAGLVLSGDTAPSAAGGPSAAVAAPGPAPVSAGPAEDPSFIWDLAATDVVFLNHGAGQRQLTGQARVLDTKGAPIPGLFAAGSTVGGLDGGPHSGYVGGLIKAVIGLIAAETICNAEALTPAS